MSPRRAYLAGSPPGGQPTWSPVPNIPLARIARAGLAAWWAQVAMEPAERALAPVVIDKEAFADSYGTR
jgi:hypothetical protein